MYAPTWTRLSGKAAGYCADCGRFRSCRVYVSERGVDMLLCGSCREDDGRRVVDRGNPQMRDVEAAMGKVYDP